MEFTSHIAAVSQLRTGATNTFESDFENLGELKGKDGKSPENKKNDDLKSLSTRETGKKIRLSTE